MDSPCFILKPTLGEPEQRSGLWYERRRPCNLTFIYHSPEIGEYLCQVVMAAASIGQVGDFREISALGEEKGADMVLVEYQNNNLDLDNWVAQTSGKPQGPEIYLFVDQESPLVLWKAIKLGARENFCGTIPQRLPGGACAGGVAQAMLGR
jgi:hypothetical protein